MTFTPAARSLLQRLEGCRLTAYRDQAGVLTIGYGHTGPDVRPGLVWTQAQADAQLDNDVQRFILGVQSMLGGEPLTDNQFSALVIFAFNVGLTALHGSTALRCVKLGQLAQVPAALMLWNKIHDASGVPVVDAGLVKRREAECNLWRTA